MAYIPVELNTTYYCPDAALVGETLGADRSVEDCAARCFAFVGSNVKTHFEGATDYRSRQCRVFRFETEETRHNHPVASRRKSRCSLYTSCDSYNTTTERDGRGDGYYVADSYAGDIYRLNRRVTWEDTFIFIGPGECRGPNPPGVPTDLPRADVFNFDYQSIPKWVYPSSHFWYSGSQIPGRYVAWETKTADECEQACTDAGFECMGYATCVACAPQYQCVLYAAGSLSVGRPSGFGEYLAGSGSWIATFDPARGGNSSSGWACYARPVQTRYYVWSEATNLLGWSVIGGDSSFSMAASSYSSRVNGLMAYPWSAQNHERVHSHTSVLARSPTFCDPREIAFQMQGGMSTSGTVPGQPGFLGAALRDVATDNYVQFSTNDKYREEHRDITWDLGAGLSGCYTLDLIDAADGGWEWVAIQKVKVVSGIEPFCQLVTAVRVRMARTGWLNITEIQIYDNKGVNVALDTNGGVASASDRGQESEVLNDGNATSLSGALELSYEGSAPWAQIELKSPRVVMKVVVVTPSSEPTPLILEFIASGAVMHQMLVEVESSGTNETGGYTYSATAYVCDGAKVGKNLDNQTAMGDGDDPLVPGRCVDGVRAGGDRHVCGLSPVHQGRGDPYVRIDTRVPSIAAGVRVRRARFYYGGSDGAYSGTRDQRVWGDYPERGDEDGGGTELGTVTRFVEEHWVEVRWDTDLRLEKYRWGLDGKYDVEMVPGQAADRREAPTQAVDYVRVYPRRDCCTSDFDRFEVWVGSNGDAPEASGNTRCYNGTADADDVVVDAPCGATGRYVYVLLPGGDRTLGFLEVEVHAPPDVLVPVYGVDQISSDHYGTNSTLYRTAMSGDYDSIACARLPAEGVSVMPSSCGYGLRVVFADAPVPSPRQACDPRHPYCSARTNWTAPTNITEWPSILFSWDVGNGNAEWIGGGYDLQSGDPQADGKQDGNRYGVWNCTAEEWHTIRRVAPTGAGEGTVEVLVNGKLVHTFDQRAPGPMYACVMPLDIQSLYYSVDVCSPQDVWCAGLPYEKASLVIAGERTGRSASGARHGDGVVGNFKNVILTSDSSRERAVSWAASLETAHSGTNYTSLSSCASPALMMTFERSDGVRGMDSLQARFIADAEIYVSLYFNHRAALPWLLRHGWSPVTFTETASRVPTMDSALTPLMIYTKSFSTGQWVEMYGNGDHVSVPGSAPYAVCILPSQTVTPSTSHKLVIYEGFDVNYGDCGNIEIANPPDATRSSSSSLGNDILGVGHNRGRLGSLQAWTAGTNTRGEWYMMYVARSLGVDWDWLRGPSPEGATGDQAGTIGRRIAGLVMQGRKVAIEAQSQWVTRFTVKRSMDGINWWDVDHGRIFQGNYDHSTQVKVLFAEPVWARYVRVYPVEWHRAISLRVALLVCSGALPSYTGFVENSTASIHRCAVDLDTANDSHVEGSGALRLSAGYHHGPLEEWIGAALTQTHTGLTAWLEEHPYESWMFRSDHIHFQGLSNASAELGETCGTAAIEAEYSAYDYSVSRVTVWGKVDSVARNGAWRFEYSHYRADGGIGTVVFETGVGGGFYGGGVLGGGVTPGQWFSLSIEVVRKSGSNSGREVHSLKWSMSGSAPRQAEATIGTRVIAHGLAAAKQLHINGMEGTVLRRISTDFFIVKFDDARVGTRGLYAHNLRVSEDDATAAPPRGRGVGEVVVRGWTTRLARIRLVKDYPSANAWFDALAVWADAAGSPPMMSFDDPGLLDETCPQYLGYNTSGDFPTHRLTASPRPHLREAACMQECCDASWCTGVVVTSDNETRGCALIRQNFSTVLADPSQPAAGKYTWWDHKFLLKLAHVTAAEAPEPEVSELDLRAQPWAAAAPHEMDGTHTSPRGTERWGMPDGWGGGSVRSGSAAAPVAQAMARTQPRPVIRYVLKFSGAETGITASTLRLALQSSRTSTEEPNGFEANRDYMLPSGAITISRRPAPHPGFHDVTATVDVYSTPGYHITTDEVLTWDSMSSIFTENNVSIYTKGGTVVGAAMLPPVRLRAVAPCDGTISCSGSPCVCSTEDCMRAYVCGCQIGSVVLPSGSPQLQATWRVGDVTVVSRDEAYVRMRCAYDGSGRAKWEDAMFPYLGTRGTVTQVLSDYALELEFSDGYIQAFPIEAVTQVYGISVCRFHRRPSDWTFDAVPRYPSDSPPKFPYYH
eukprot:TRINITY_DN26455_c0_g1_i2.p1 TRINITY_DN26455_c0_g1~~TRINITY_DN26455_c0_g1_i2.p1  ORF type:complete len:2456 (+),score=541.17 TRINITY_DN26455_c0_g1_i2:863-7369(+)